MDISKHLSTLLKFHECVIIPDFGGFISNYIPSRYDPVRNVYMPPAKEIVFNSKIIKNDGLLINHLVESEFVGYSQAHSAVSNWVNFSFEKLNKGEIIELSGVGTLAFDRYGSFVFNSTGENILAEAYGLEEVNYSKLTRPVYSDTFQPRPAIRVINNRKNIIRIAAGVALVISLSIVPVKKENSNFLSSNLNPFASLTTTPLPVKSPEKEAVGSTDNNSSLSENQITVKELPYILVGGSFEIFENAQSFHNKLLKEGNHSELFEKKKGLYKVTIDSYNSKNKALAAMESYRASHPGSQVWVSTR
jgi:hypothetical protein